jgi:hypothetical protein
MSHEAKQNLQVNKTEGRKNSESHFCILLKKVTAFRIGEYIKKQLEESKKHKAEKLIEGLIEFEVQEGASLRDIIFGIDLSEKQSGFILGFTNTAQELKIITTQEAKDIKSALFPNMPGIQTTRRTYSYSCISGFNKLFDFYRQTQKATESLDI